MKTTDTPSPEAVTPTGQAEPNLVGLYDCGYYKTSFLREVESEPQSKAFVVKAGLATFSRAEQLAYMILESRDYFHE